MTKAMNKALDLYPAPEEWTPGQGLPTRLTDDEREDRARAIMLRSSLVSDEWPRMVRAFRMVMQRELPSKPTPLPPAEKEHHATLLMSEVHEFSAAGDVVNQADGLFDVIYVALGALAHLGLTDTQILAGFAEVHASNMTKVQDSGKPLINDGVIAPDEPIGKVLKTHNYVRPALAEAMSIE
jgi:predicted HAD superfamily Cof-like phosphohydrolase